MNKYRFSAFLSTILLLSLSLPVFPGVVDTALGRKFTTIFPELSKGYIDLNANGKMDRLDDMDEKIPDSGVKDGILQVQEILEFIEVNYRFISIDKLRSAYKALTDASGDIPKLIALNYSQRIDTVIKNKERLGADSLYLTPSALKKAQDEMRGYIATMLNAYKKEQKKYESDFSAASDQLFRMIETGYPLPELSKDDYSLLVNLTIYTVDENKTSNSKRVHAAIRTLGRLKARQAIPYLKKLLESPEYGYESAVALGNIGNSDAREVLIGKIKEGAEGRLQEGIIQALGNTGGDDSIKILLSMLDSKDGEKINPETEKAAVRALSTITEKDTRNRKVYSVLTSYLENNDKELRILAIKGIANYKTDAAVSLLLPLLKKEKSEDVLIELVKSLSATNSARALPAVTAMLTDPNSSADLKKEIIHAVGENSNGSKSVLNIIDYLGDKNSEIRSTTAKTILKLYKQNPAVVTGAVSRKLSTRKDELFQKEASAILAVLADPATTVTLTNLLSSSYPSVKKNATWALYRIKPENNLKVVTELQKLVTGETESIEVRINSVRALGAMGFDPPRTDVWKTLLTAFKLQDEKYTMLKLYSVKAIGELGTVNDQILKDITSLISREKNETVRQAAVDALKTMNGLTPAVERILSGTFKRSTDNSLRLSILEVLSDMRSDETSVLAPSLLTGEQNKETKYRVIYALSHMGDEKSLSVLLDLINDQEVSVFLTGVLEDADGTVMRELLARRLKTESNPEKLRALEELSSSFEETF